MHRHSFGNNLRILTFDVLRPRIGEVQAESQHRTDGQGVLVAAERQHHRCARGGEQELSREEALRNFDMMRTQAMARNPEGMTSEEIDAEIKAVRTQRD